MEAILTGVELFELQRKEPDPDVMSISGLGVSEGVYEGIARRCDGAGELDRIRPGDVLVTSTTSPAINVVLPLLGAIVTDRGGALCHAAIVTREFGIPGVVGTRTATQRIKDGARVRVDGRRGIVELLS
jgi:pyruvate,water dikinase